MHSARADESRSSSGTKTNLAVMQTLIESMTRQIIEHANVPRGGNVVITFQESMDSWIAQNSFIAAFSSSGFRVFTQQDTVAPGNTVFDVRGTTLTVSYNNMFREGIWGAEKVKRTVTTALTCNATNLQTHEVLYSNSVSEMFSDTVAVDEIPSLELLSAKSTHGELPDEGFFNRMLEPIVIVGAAGVAVYLFFHVRS